MTARPLLLAIDQGTQSARALLFDLDGALVAASQIPIEPFVSPHPGWAEQDPNVFWDAIGRACRELWTKPGADRDRVAGVAFTCQRGTAVFLDERGEPLRPAISWLDQRRATQLPAVPAIIRAGASLIGLAPILRDFQEQAECNWVAEHEPEVWRRTARFGMVSAFLLWKLGGRFVDATSSQVGFLPFDFKRHEWARAGDPMWRALTARREQLPELVPPGRELGAITDEAASATGIPAGLPIISAGADKACEALGSGALEPHIAALSYGTTATLNVCSRRYLEATRFVPPYPAALPGAWNVEQMVFRGYWMVEWWKREFAHREVAEAGVLGVAPESLFERFLDETPPGAMGLMLQPYWSPGLRVPGPDGKGALIGFGDVHGRAHVYRAILEGIAYALREAKERVEARTGTPIRELRVGGGGARSMGALQITADVFNLPVERPHVHEASGLGAAINAAVGLGLHADYATAVSRMVHIGARVEPRPEVARTYDQLFCDVYAPLYGRLAPLYRAIRRITGYPR